MNAWPVSGAHVGVWWEPASAGIPKRDDAKCLYFLSWSSFFYVYFSLLCTISQPSRPSANFDQGQTAPKAAGENYEMSYMILPSLCRFLEDSFLRQVNFDKPNATAGLGKYMYETPPGICCSYCRWFWWRLGHFSKNLCVQLEAQ